MRKIPTLFKRDPENMRVLLPEVNPDCQWVIDGREVIPTRKYDGTCTMLNESGQWLARREIKPGGREPANFIGVQMDPVTGKEVGWEPIEQSAFFKAFQTVEHVPTKPWTYELCGPKVNRNPEGFDAHVLIPHGGEEVLRVVDHLEPLVSSRGFKHWPEVSGTYPGTHVRVYESSAACVEDAEHGGPFLWLLANNMHGSTTVHLGYGDVGRLRDQLNMWLDTHEDKDEPLTDSPDVDLLTGVELFMEKAKQLDTVGLPRDVEDPLRQLRRRMLLDPLEGEVAEYFAAEMANDPVEILDGLLDTIVIAWGTVLAYFGADIGRAAAAEVTRSNLDKVFPEPVFRESDGKVLKPEGWRPPAIADILDQAEFEIGVVS